MKKAHFFLIAFAIFLWACDSGGEDPDNNPDEKVEGCTDPAATNYNSAANYDDCNCQYDGFSGIGAAPASAVKNVLIEEFTGEWCGWCVDGTVVVEELMHANPGRVFTSAIHQGDFMENDLTRPLMTLFGASSFPSGVIDRKGGALGRNLWAGRTSLGLNETAKAHLAIETKLNGETLEGVVHVDFKEDLSAGDYRLLIYITESGIPAVRQSNYYNGLAGAESHPYYNKPSVLSGTEFIHNFVLRKSVGLASIPEKALKGDGTFTRKFDVDLSQYNKENIEVLAVIADKSFLNAVNVYGVKAGQTASWQ